MWPIADESCNAVLCTQILEHISDDRWTVAEMYHVLQPEGLLLISVPFVFSEHGIPQDFRRFSRSGIQDLVADKFEVMDIKTQCG